MKNCAEPFSIRYSEFGILLGTLGAGPNVMKSRLATVALLVASAALASEPRASFRHLTPEQGLSHPSVYGVTRASSSAITFAARNAE